MPASPEEAALSAACLMDPVEDLLILPNPNPKHRKSQRSRWPAARSTDSGSLAWPHARTRTIGNFSLDAIIGSSDTAPPISHSAMHLNRKVGTRGAFSGLSPGGCRKGPSRAACAAATRNWRSLRCLGAIGQGASQRPAAWTKTLQKTRFLSATGPAPALGASWRKGRSPADRLGSRRASTPMEAHAFG